MKNLQKLYPHILAIIGFVFIALIYFYPVLQGKKIYQSDIVQYTGMAKEQIDFRANNDNAETYWTNSAFGGMPTYQLGAKYPHNYIKKVDEMIRFLPRPADYLFLYFFGFYILMLVLKTDALKAFFGALAFGLSTYLIIILGVGHNAKAHAIGYMPLIVAGVILVFKQRYILGGILTTFAVALELSANHIQMTYYLLFLILPIAVYFICKLYKTNEINHLPKIIGVFALSGVLALGANATNLLATAEYAKTSTRDKSELTFLPDGSKPTTNNAMSFEYITEYSYGIAESFNLIAPRLLGGGSSEKLDENSETYNFILEQGASEAEATDFVKHLPLYWGDQTIVAAPAYIGAVVFFLAILCLFIDKRKIKYAILAGAILALVLSWGKNYSGLTRFFIDFVPMYDKFRAVSSIQVILELCMPILAVMGLQSFFKQTKNDKLKTLLYSFSVAFGLIVLLFLCKSMFEFNGINDGYIVQQYGKIGQPLIDAIKMDRKSIYSADLFRSGCLILLVAGVLWLFIKQKLAQNTAIIIIGVLMVGDLFLVDQKYLNAKECGGRPSFVSAFDVDEPFQATEADLQILEDKSNFRVFEVSGNLSSARSSYFHHSIGGYSAVKPRRIQQLFDYQIAKNNLEVLNMLNVKYIIQKNDKDEDVVGLNPKANGNAWFVSKLKFVNSADDEMKALDKIDSKNIAFKSHTVDGIYKEMPSNTETFIKDSTSTITVSSYKPNEIKYTTKNKNNGFAVFSENYYKNGWKATIDGKETPIMRVDYVLRGLKIPAGNHKIEFKFEPQVVKTGSIISLISFLIMIGLTGFFVYLKIAKIKKSSKFKVQSF
jgi:Bacterial membrane protein YfhO